MIGMSEQYPSTGYGWKSAVNLGLSLSGKGFSLKNRVPGKLAFELSKQD